MAGSIETKEYGVTLVTMVVCLSVGLWLASFLRET